MGELKHLYCTTREAETILNACDTSIRTWWRAGLLSDPILVGRRTYLWHRKEVEALRDRREAERARTRY